MMHRNRSADRASPDVPARRRRPRPVDYRRDHDESVVWSGAGVGFSGADGWRTSHAATAEHAFVTGATGFVGSHLVRHLARGGWRVTAPGRDWRPAQIREGAVVYHLAGRAHRRQRSARRYVEDNCELAVATYRTAARRGASAFVFVSTAKVLGEASREPLTRGHVPAPVGFYARSKLLAEESLAELHARLAVPLAVVRPPLVYGPGVGANFLALLRWVYSGLPLPIGGAGGLRSMVSVSNLVHFLERAARPPEGLAGTLHRWHVRDDEELSSHDLARRIAACMQRRSYLPNVPRQGLDAAARLLGRRDLVTRLFEPFQIDDADTRAALGWRPPVTLDQELETTVNWYLAS